MTGEFVLKFVRVLTLAAWAACGVLLATGIAVAAVASRSGVGVSTDLGDGALAIGVLAFLAAGALLALGTLIQRPAWAA